MLSGSELVSFFAEKKIFRSVVACVFSISMLVACDDDSDNTIVSDTLNVELQQVEAATDVVDSFTDNTDTDSHPEQGESDTNPDDKGNIDEGSVLHMQVLHASPDTPSIEFSLDGESIISPLAFEQLSEVVSLPVSSAGVQLDGVIQSDKRTVLSIDDILLQAVYPQLLVLADTLERLQAIPVNRPVSVLSEQRLSLTVLHAAIEVADEVDVYLVDDNAQLENEKVTFAMHFTEQVELESIEAQPRAIRITNKGSKDVLFDSGRIDLSVYAGERLILVALPTLSGKNVPKSPLQLILVRENGESELIRSLNDRESSIRVVHLSPNTDNLVGSLEVFANRKDRIATESIAELSYLDIMPSANDYTEISSGTYNLTISADNRGGENTVFSTHDMSFKAGREYNIFAIGRLDDEPSFDVIVDAVTQQPPAQQASVTVLHALPALGAVDVYFVPAGEFSVLDILSGNAGDPMLENFEFSSFADELVILPGIYDICLVADDHVAVDVSSIEFKAGDTVTIAVVGNAEPSADTYADLLFLQD